MLCTAADVCLGAQSVGGFERCEVESVLPVLRLCAAACEKAGAAEDGATLRGVKRNGRLLTALRAVDGNFDALADTRSLCGGNGGQTLVLCLLAGLAAFRLVLQTLVVKEDLLAASPDEVFVTVNATDVAVLIFGFGVRPFAIRLACCLSL